MSDEIVEDLSLSGTGRRKTAVAQVRLFEGKGLFEVNKRPFEEYFPLERFQSTVLKPLHVTKTRNDFDIKVKVAGGGPTGQAGAVSLGIARALCKAESEFHKMLRDAGLLTRDARMVERKKPGRHKARRGKQFSKR